MTLRSLVGLLALAALPRWAPAQDSPLPTTVILVRHAEKSIPLGDFPLSGEGRARARELARVLENARVAAIYTTQFLRTQQTAQPLAKQLGLPVTVVVTTKTYVADQLERIRAEHEGQTVLVVSHRLVVPELIEALGVAPAPTIPEEQYDNLYIVTIPPNSSPTMVVLHYGRPTR